MSITGIQKEGDSIIPELELPIIHFVFFIHSIYIYNLSKITEFRHNGCHDLHIEECANLTSVSNIHTHTLWMSKCIKLNSPLNIYSHTALISDMKIDSVNCMIYTNGYNTIIKKKIKCQILGLLELNPKMKNLINIVYPNLHTLRLFNPNLKIFNKFNGLFNLDIICCHNDIKKIDISCHHISYNVFTYSQNMDKAMYYLVGKINYEKSDKVYKYSASPYVINYFELDEHQYY